MLTEFEWDEGMTMPVANAENKYLEEDVSTIHFNKWRDCMV